PGAGSTVKIIHQLLAGVHIAAAAEAMALAARAGIPLDVMYDVAVTGATEASVLGAIYPANPITQS
ncbi:NAD-binding protein, partial [Salmonella enterica subsp. enterica serovar Cerro]|nr:NAD-binding protein [Salmonella enterica subsp. enterica serovar Cerro]